MEMGHTGLSSNWKKLQATLETTSVSKSKQDQSSTAQGVKRKSQQQASLPNKRGRFRELTLQKTAMQNGKPATLDTNANRKAEPANHNPKTSSKVNLGFSQDVEAGKYLALDCEMVGIGPPPSLTSMLARVSIVNYHGDQVYDSFVCPTELVTDYRTPVSGITASDLAPGKARPFGEVQSQVAELLKGRIVIGHALRNDFAVLGLPHPRSDQRDTSRYSEYRNQWGYGGSPKLKVLAIELLGLGADFHDGVHNSVEDARAALMLYKRDRKGIDQEVLERFGSIQSVRATATGEPATSGQATGKSKKKSNTKKKKRRKK